MAKTTLKKSNKARMLIIILAVAIGGIGLYITYSQRPDSEESGSTSEVNKTGNLSAITKDYVNRNYPDYKITKTTDDPLCGGGQATDVLIENSQKDNLSLIFTLDGKFIQKEVDVNFAAMPNNIKTVLAQKFPNYVHGDSVEQLTLVSGQQQYLVDLTQDKKTLEVIFDLTGSVVCSG